MKLSKNKQYIYSIHTQLKTMIYLYTIHILSILLSSYQTCKTQKMII